uniref:Uncharacterized protein n=1 Tax=Kalanchoe fedtschenkoi TaxID=63787 RepID=A0A7N0UHL4_KALFE
MSSSILVGCGEESASMPSKLPLLSLFPFPPGHEDASSSGSSTPPFHSSASVPFKWEEEPGKPINHCTALIPFAQPLIPPPPSRRTTKTPSPTTVLDGPPSPETGLLGPMVMMMSHSEQNKSITKKKKRLFGSWPWGSRRTAGNCNKMEVVGRERDNNKGSGLGGSFVYSSSSSTAAFSFSCSLDDVGIRECCSEYGGESECAVGESAAAVKQMRKSRSFINFAQVMPWKSRKHGTST